MADKPCPLTREAFEIAYCDLSSLDIRERHGILAAIPRVFGCTHPRGVLNQSCEDIDLATKMIERGVAAWKELPHG